MFAPIKLGDLGIFDTVTWDVKTETSLYLDDLFFAGSERVSEMFQNPRVSRVNLIPNNFSPARIGAGKHFPPKVVVISLYVWSYWHKKVV
jgi:hypothetical protein